MENMKKQNRKKAGILRGRDGITLLALIVTIIVLLVLAGVSIAVLTGENGIINNAIVAKRATEKAAIDEQLKLAIMASYGTNGKINLNRLNNEISSVGGEVSGTEFPVTVVKNKVALVVEESGETVDIDKTKVENLPDSWKPAYSSNYKNDWYAYKDNAGNIAHVNAPKLADGMTAIKYVAGSDTATYETVTTGSKWANAMTKDGSMWVWIPRYAYKITNGYHKSGQDLNSTDKTKGAGTIEIAFLDKNNNFLDSSLSGQTVKTSGITDSDYGASGSWILAPGFEFGDEHLDGFWFAKFEASNTDGYGDNSSTANNTELTLQIKPNVTSWRSITSENIFTVCRNLENSTTYFNSSTNVDTHMTKNVEWGAVAYLAHSKYGLNGQEEIYINNNNGYKTGISGTTATASSSSDSSNTYNTTVGINASTTKNVYGIYDMSGGAYEYVAACLTGYTNQLNSTADTKYIDVYSSYAISKYGDAVYETSNSSSGSNSWFSDYSDFVSGSRPVFVRDGDYTNVSNAGLFSFSYGGGIVYSECGFRPVCVVE